ncbi:TetR/AcrR family transcriptional regulator [Prauserella rugosa]|uniref:TetR family transcriptional regulator n=1 Tax=Prauserella rugosa TaxID=43354 RepID=A0A660CG78_9PSEU|nr:TetR/AcrR family transcriptional regulator [Prauserella rugosa]KID30704.1 transcriptional regulator, TetR family [Prauserella sp. Am3]KMS91958.1 TetR family transcriptional regulator [Streptomyces regensis]TWH20001.1 TetR family transcriptional regulator [Prauserella rugosa]
MGRPERHTRDDFLDAAARLFADGGTRAVTMSAVARAAGAPSGSLYHRFADRPALLAALWTRTVDRFQAGYLEQLRRTPPVEGAVAAAAHVVRWCREHPAEAHVLHAGKRAFDTGTWPEPDRAAGERSERELRRALQAACRTLRAATRRSTDELLLVLVDLPYATVHRHLSRGDTPPARAVTTATAAARALLTPSDDHPSDAPR